jgi:hypothetical protein
LTISYTGDATIAGALGGTAHFSWLTTSLVVDTFFPLGKPIDIGPLSAVPGKNSFFISFQPTDPCSDPTSCQLNFSFGGKSARLTPLHF